MGLNINGFLRTVIQGIGPAISQAVSGAPSSVTNFAAGLLRQITSGFDGLAGNGNGLLGNLHLPGPLGFIANKYLQGFIAGSALGALLTGGLGGTSSNGGGIQNFLKDLISKLTGRTLEDGSQITPEPTFGGRDVNGELQQIETVLQQILTRLGGGAFPGTGSVGGAATTIPQIPTSFPTFPTLPPGAPNIPNLPGTPTIPTIPTIPGGGAVVDGSVQQIVKDGLAANNGSFSTDEQTMIDSVSDPKQKAMLQAQFRMQHMQETVSFITNMMKKQNEIAMALINNLR